MNEIIENKDIKRILDVVMASYTNFSFRDIYQEREVVIVTLVLDKENHLNIKNDDWVFISSVDNFVFGRSNLKTDAFNAFDAFEKHKNDISLVYKEVLIELLSLENLILDSSSNAFLYRLFKRIDKKDMDSFSIVLFRLKTQEKEKPIVKLNDRDFFTKVYIGDLLSPAKVEN